MHDLIIRGAAGQGGVESVLEILRAELHRALVLMGGPSVASLDRSWLLPRLERPGS